MTSIAMSSGHGQYVRGARGNPVPPQLDEVDQARRVVDRVAELLKQAGVDCATFHDNTSHDQDTNLETIVAWHNSRSRTLDVSVHFNAYDGSAHGVEVLWVTQEQLAKEVSAAIAAAGPFTNRGAKYRDNLYVLNNTDEPAILIETCFCDHTGDSTTFTSRFEDICCAIAEAISGQAIGGMPDRPDKPELPDRPDRPEQPPPADEVPQWLQTMRNITGLSETPGEADNPKILMMAQYIGQKYPEMKSYCDSYNHDSIAWCGLCMAYCVATADIRPPFGPTDTDKFLWAQSFSTDPAYKDTGRPHRGTIVVTTREGGGHVTCFEEMDGYYYSCRGGNQSDAVNVMSVDPDTVIGHMWPKAAGEPPMIPVEDRPLLEKGDSGPDVVDLQEMLPRFEGDVDGDVGSITENAVIEYQRSRGLDPDGMVGQETWTALYENKPPLPPPPPPPGAFTLFEQEQIRGIASDSPIAEYDWEDRGQAPSGYTQGMALAFAQSYRKLKAKHPAVVKMAQKRRNSDKDALNVYKAQYKALHRPNEKAGANVLVNLYALMLGHGMRESSGKHCEGRDMSASNVESDTCEAGLFQTSYNAHSASDPEFDNLMTEYMATANKPLCYLEAFAENVSCSADDWDNYGSGKGEEFQALCKECPAFAVESAALTLRMLCNHYGPIIRQETELKSDAVDLFEEVREYVDSLDETA